MMDANIDFLTWRDNDLPPYHSSFKLKPLIDLLFEKILPLGVTQLVKDATRIQRGCPKTGLDHVYSNKIDKISHVQTYLTGMSDHKLVKVIRQSKSIRHRPKFIRKRIFKDFYPKVFKTMVGAADLEETLKCSNVNMAVETLVSKISNVLDKIAPLRTIQIRTNYVPGLQSETKDLMRQRDNAHKKAAATDSPEDWKLFRSIRNRVTALIRRDKKLWEQKKLDCSLNDSEQTWRTVKSWLNWGSSGPPTQLVFDGKIISSPSRISNIMNNFFTDKVKSLRNKIPAESSDPLSKLKEAMCHY